MKSPRQPFLGLEPARRKLTTPTDSFSRLRRSSASDLAEGLEVHEFVETLPAELAELFPSEGRAAAIGEREVEPTTSC